MVIPSFGFHSLDKKIISRASRPTNRNLPNMYIGENTSILTQNLHTCENHECILLYHTNDGSDRCPTNSKVCCFVVCTQRWEINVGRYIKKDCHSLFFVLSVFLTYWIEKPIHILKAAFVTLWKFWINGWGHDRRSRSRSLAENDCDSYSLIQVIIIQLYFWPKH